MRSLERINEDYEKFTLRRKKLKEKLDKTDKKIMEIVSERTEAENMEIIKDIRSWDLSYEDTKELITSLKNEFLGKSFLEEMEVEKDASKTGNTPMEKPMSIS